MKVAPLLFAASVLALEPFAEHALLTAASHKAPLPCECIGPSPSRINIVYLHGLDTFGPSWTEIRNRDKLRAMSRLLGARIALPRSRSSWLSQPSATQIRAAADSCFQPGEPFVVVGFSDGANAVNQLFLDCRTDVASHYVSIGGAAFEGRRDAGTTPCSLALIAGQHEPGLVATRLRARQLAKQGADVRFYEHPGPHELPLRETISAVLGQ